MASVDGLARKSVAGDSYRLVVYTSDKFGAGTDATVRIEFYDAWDQAWQPTIPQDKDLYERKGKDEFQVGGWGGGRLTAVVIQPTDQPTGPTSQPIKKVTPTYYSAAIQPTNCSN